MKPGRTDTNIRYCDEAQLKYLLNVSLLKAPNSKTDTRAYIYELAENFPEKRIFITGNPYFMEKPDCPGNLLLIPSLQELILNTGRIVR